MMSKALKVGGVIAYCFVILLALDFAYSNFIYDKPERARIRSDRFDHTLKANYQGFDTWGPLRHRLMTNSLGMKDGAVREVPLKPNGKRVLLIGDSFTEAVGMPFEKSFAGMLFQAGLEADPKIEFLNAAVMSYSPVIYFQKIKYLIEKSVHFDEVVVFSDLSDVQDEAGVYFCIDDDPQYRDRCRLANDQKTRKLGRVLADNFAVTDRIRKTIKRKLRQWRGHKRLKKNEVRGRHRRVDWTLPDFKDERHYAPLGVAGGIKRSLQNMQKLADLLAAHDIPLTIVVYPWPSQLTFNDRDSRQITIWREFCAQNCKAFINLFPAFFAEKDAHNDWYERLFIPGDVHFSAAGNEFFYRQIVNDLIGPQVTRREPKPPYFGAISGAGAR